MKRALLEEATAFVQSHCSKEIRVSIRDMEKSPPFKDRPAPNALHTYGISPVTGERVYSLVALNSCVWDDLNPCCRESILLHEVGHAETDHRTEDPYKKEVYAHAWAMRYAKLNNMTNNVIHLKHQWKVWRGRR